MTDDASIVADRGEALRVTLKLPGTKRKAIAIDVSPREVAVKVSGKTSYTWLISLPVDVAPESAEATFRSDILVVTLAKRQGSPASPEAPTG